MSPAQEDAQQHRVPGRHRLVGPAGGDPLAEALFALVRELECLRSSFSSDGYLALLDQAKSEHPL
jgi:hypothetical protein